MVKHGGTQCGFCTPGIVMSAVALLRDNPNPTDADIRHAIAGNICRCTGYDKVVRAIADGRNVNEGRLIWHFRIRATHPDQSPETIGRPIARVDGRERTTGEARLSGRLEPSWHAARQDAAQPARPRPGSVRSTRARQRRWTVFERL